MSETSDPGIAALDRLLDAVKSERAGLSADFCFDHAFAEVEKEIRSQREYLVNRIRAKARIAATVSRFCECHGITTVWRVGESLSCSTCGKPKRPPGPPDPPPNPMKGFA